MATVLERLAASRLEQGEASPHVNATRLDIGGVQITATAAELNALDGITATVAELNTLDGITATVAELNIMDGVTATAAELNRVADVSARLVAGGATLTLTQALHDGKTVLWDQATGSVFTLPAATGTGMKIRLVVSVTATSNNHSVACVGTDEFNGSLTSIDVDTGDATLAFAAEEADDFDTITFNRTTTGLAAVGDWVELQDIKSGTWAVTGVYRANGVVATPFSSAV